MGEFHKEGYVFMLKGKPFGSRKVDEDQNTADAFTEACEELKESLQQGTIRDAIIKGTLGLANNKLDELKAKGIAGVLTSVLRHKVKELEKGEIEISGDVECLDEELMSVQREEGFFGSIYYKFNIINDESIHYEPNRCDGNLIRKVVNGRYVSYGCGKW